MYNNEEGKLNVKPKVQFSLQNISIIIHSSRSIKKKFINVYSCVAHVPVRMHTNVCM